MKKYNETEGEFLGYFLGILIVMINNSVWKVDDWYFSSLTTNYVHVTYI